MLRDDISTFTDLSEGLEEVKNHLTLHGIETLTFQLIFQSIYRLDYSGPYCLINDLRATVNILSL